MVPGEDRLITVNRPTAHSTDPLGRPRLTVLRGGIDGPTPAAAPLAASRTSPELVVSAESTAPARRDATEILAADLVEEFGDRVLFLFHRRAPGPGGDLPIIAVTSTGVHLIEPRSYVGRKIRACHDGSTFVIDGVRHTSIGDQMLDHGEALQAAIQTGPLPDAPISLAYCFVDGKLPWRTLEVDGIRALSTRQVIKRLRAKGPLDERQVEALHRDLSLRLPRI